MAKNEEMEVQTKLNKIRRPSSCCSVGWLLHHVICKIMHVSRPSLDVVTSVVKQEKEAQTSKGPC